MARIRTIKPEFWTDEDLSEVSEAACLLAIGLLNYADDEGYFNANEKLIKAAVFPIRDTSSSITVLLRELSDCGYLCFFKGSDGKRYGLVKGFAKHQVINKKTASKIKHLCELPENYGSDTVELPTGKERKGKEEEGSKDSSSDNSDELPGQAEQDKTAAFLAKYPEAVGGCYTPSGSKWGSATDRECAQWIYDRVLMVNSAAKEPNWPVWSNDIRLMRQADGRNHKEICELFKWANQDSFWQANILSPGKLREKWDTLAAKRNSGGGQNGNGGGQSKMSRIMNNINDLNW